MRRAAARARGDAPLRLKLAPQLDLRPRRSDDAPATSFGRADRMSSRQTPEGAVTVLDGAAELRQAGTLLHADEIRYNQGTNEVEAIGDVTVDQGGTRIAGPQPEAAARHRPGRVRSPTYDLPATAAAARPTASR